MPSLRATIRELSSRLSVAPNESGESAESEDARSHLIAAVDDTTPPSDSPRVLTNSVNSPQEEEGEEVDEIDAFVKPPAVQVNPPEYLIKGLRCFWGHIITAEATASRIAGERARIRGRSATLENIYEIFRQLTPEIDLVSTTGGRENSHPQQKRAKVTANDTGPSERPSKINSENDVTLIRAVYRREDSPEIVSLFEGPPLALKWKIQTFRSNGSSDARTENDSQQIRRRWCFKSQQQILRSDWATKLWSFDRLLAQHSPPMRRKLDVYHQGLSEMDLSTPIDSILKCTVCPICFRMFRDSRLFQDDVLQLSLNLENETCDIVVPQCGHLMCSDCFKRIESRSSSSASSKACPSCRHKIKHAYPLRLS